MLTTLASGGSAESLGEPEFDHAGVDGAFGGPATDVDLVHPATLLGVGHPIAFKNHAIAGLDCGR